MAPLFSCSIFVLGGFCTRSLLLRRPFQCFAFFVPELFLGAPLTEAELADKGLVNSDEVITDTDKLDYYSEYGFRFGYTDGCYGDSFEVNGDIVSAISSYYENMEITKIQGNLYFKK